MALLWHLEHEKQAFSLLTCFIFIEWLIAQVCHCFLSYNGNLSDKSLGRGPHEFKVEQDAVIVFGRSGHGGEGAGGLTLACWYLASHRFLGPELCHGSGCPQRGVVALIGPEHWVFEREAPASLLLSHAISKDTVSSSDFL